MVPIDPLFCHWAAAADPLLQAPMPADSLPSRVSTLARRSSLQPSLRKVSRFSMKARRQSAPRWSSAASERHGASWSEFEACKARQKRMQEGVREEKVSYTSKANGKGQMRFVALLARSLTGWLRVQGCAGSRNLSRGLPKEKDSTRLEGPAPYVPIAGAHASGLFWDLQVSKAGFVQGATLALLMTLARALCSLSLCFDFTVADRVDLLGRMQVHNEARKLWLGAFQDSASPLPLFPPGPYRRRYYGISLSNL